MQTVGVPTKCMGKVFVFIYLIRNVYILPKTVLYQTRFSSSGLIFQAHSQIPERHIESKNKIITNNSFY